MYDAVLILGGSYIDQNTLPSWVQSRLNAAIYQEGKTELFIVLSRGTPHKPPVMDEDDFAVDECTIMANYLIDRGISNTKILKDAWSFDTIGNAYAALTMHAIPRNLRRLLVITSDFHMPRTKAIFRKVFSLHPLDIFKLEFLETESSLSISEKETRSLETWIERSKSIHTLMDLHDFIFTKHDAYNSKASNKGSTVKYTDKDMQMYCV